VAGGERQERHGHDHRGIRQQRDARTRALVPEAHQQGGDRDEGERQHRERRVDPDRARGEQEGEVRAQEQRRDEGVLRAPRAPGAPRHEDERGQRGRPDERVRDRDDRQRAVRPHREVRERDRLHEPAPRLVRQLEIRLRETAVGADLRGHEALEIDPVEQVAPLEEPGRPREQVDGGRHDAEGGDREGEPRRAGGRRLAALAEVSRADPDEHHRKWKRHRPLRGGAEAEGDPGSDEPAAAPRVRVAQRQEDARRSEEGGVDLLDGLPGVVHVERIDREERRGDEAGAGPGEAAPEQPDERDREHAEEQARQDEPELRVARRPRRRPDQQVAKPRMVPHRGTGMAMLDEVRGAAPRGPIVAEGRLIEERAAPDEQPGDGDRREQRAERRAAERLRVDQGATPPAPASFAANRRSAAAARPAGSSSETKCRKRPTCTTTRPRSPRSRQASRTAPLRWTSRTSAAAIGRPRPMTRRDRPSRWSATPARTATIASAIARRQRAEGVAPDRGARTATIGPSSHGCPLREAAARPVRGRAGRPQGWTTNCGETITSSVIVSSLGDKTSPLDRGRSRARCAHRRISRRGGCDKSARFRRYRETPLRVVPNGAAKCRAMRR